MYFVYVHTRTLYMRLEKKKIIIINSLKQRRTHVRIVVIIIFDFFLRFILYGRGTRDNKERANGGWTR